jgi:hypothetical protein
MAKKKRYQLVQSKNDAKNAHERLTALMHEAMLYTINETALLARLEEFFSPKPARLELKESLWRRLGEMTEKIGGVPRLIVHKIGDPPLEFDTYARAAIEEIVSSFERCRVSVCRTHACFIGSELYRQQPELTKGLPRLVKRGLLLTVREHFWEHAETSYIRLASYWDRIGQLLDFVFFNVRQYERDGFPSVMDRISSNYVRLFPNLSTARFWTELRAYQNSEKPTGFQWLVRRRNLLVHSLRLRGIEKEKGEENPIFTSAYNHLEEAVQQKLKPDTPEAELGYLHSHLEAGARLFPFVVELCEHCAASRREIYRR